MSTTAESAGERIKRVLRGAVVGVITLPSNHRLLLDARDGDLVAARLNANYALCWVRELHAGWAKGQLKRANGNIETASTPADCPGWPSRYSRLDVGGDA